MVLPHQAMVCDFFRNLLDLVVVVLAGNYNQPDAWKLSVTIMDEIVSPALRLE